MLHLVILALILLMLMLLLPFSRNGNINAVIIKIVLRLMFNIELNAMFPC
jgi:hypothetical protein